MYTNYYEELEPDYSEHRLREAHMRDYMTRQAIGIHEADAYGIIIYDDGSIDWNEAIEVEQKLNVRIAGFESKIESIRWANHQYAWILPEDCLDAFDMPSEAVI